VQTNSTGQYGFVLNSLLASGSQVIVYEGSGTSGGVAFQEGASASVTGLNIYESYVAQNALSSSTTLSTVVTDFATAQGANTIPKPTNQVLNIAAASFTIDQTPAATGTLVLNSTGTVTQGTTTAAQITATSLDLIGTGGSYMLTNTSNSIGTLAANIGAVDVNDSSSLTVGTVDGTAGVTGSGADTLAATGNLTIASGAKVTAGANDNVVLAATGNFINNQGSAAVAVSGTGRWLIYSNAAATDTFDSLNSNNAAVWDVTYPAAVAASGDRYVFAYQPTLTFTSTGVLPKTYGQDATAAVASSSYTVTGLQSGFANAFSDSNSTVFSGTPTLASQGAGTSANATATPYSITINVSGLTALNGYALAAVNNGTLTVSQAGYTAISGSKSYDGSATFLSGQVVLSGVNGETFNVAATSNSANATANPTDPSTGFISAGSTITGVSGSDPNNYTALVVTALTGSSNVAAIGQAQITVTALGGTSVYGSSARPMVSRRPIRGCRRRACRTARARAPCSTGCRTRSASCRAPAWRAIRIR
jgi:hypothetical protein